MTNPFPYSDTNKRYYTFDYMMRKRFGSKCVKIPIDAGFTCPNIDGKCGKGGCTYCTLPHRNSDMRGLDFESQYIMQTEKLSSKWEGALRLPYFQDYTNTYAPIDKLKEIYERALALPEAIGLDIATRADAIDDECLEYLRELNERTFLILELGLQTVHDKTASLINRGHSYERFLETYEKLGNLNVCIHIINSLPGETEEMMLETAREIARIHPFMLKIHMLYIEEGTPIAQDYKSGSFKLLSLEKYTRITCKQLELLPPDICIGRITGDGQKNTLIAPEWSKKKFVVMNEIDKFLAKNNTWQGVLYK